MGSLSRSRRSICLTAEWNSAAHLPRPRRSCPPSITPIRPRRPRSTCACGYPWPTDRTPRSTAGEPWSRCGEYLSRSTGSRSSSSNFHRNSRSASSASSNSAYRHGVRPAYLTKLLLRRPMAPCCLALRSTPAPRYPDTPHHDEGHRDLLHDTFERLTPHASPPRQALVYPTFVCKTVPTGHILDGPKDNRLVRCGLDSYWSAIVVCQRGA
jgi:hypothetical protein